MKGKPDEKPLTGYHEFIARKEVFAQFKEKEFKRQKKEFGKCLKLRTIKNILEEMIREEEKSEEFRAKILGYRNYIFCVVFALFMVVLYLALDMKVKSKRRENVAR